MFDGFGARRRAPGGRSWWWRAVPVPVAAAVVWCAATVPGGAATSTVVADWRMDEPAGTGELVDAGPLGLVGRIGTSIGTGVVAEGQTAHRFSTVDPDHSPVDPERLDVVAHDGRLDPGDDDVAFSVRLRTTSPQGNVVQKGQSSSTGGYMKIDMDEGRVACLYLGSAGSAHTRSAASIADGAWHEVRCVRRSDEVVLVVDGVVVSTRRTATGHIANTWPVTIGGKISCNQVTVGCDYFSGDIDRVWFERSGSLTSTAPSTTASPSSSTSAPAVVVVSSTLPVSTTVASTTTTVRPTTTTIPATTTTVAPVVK